MDLKLATQSSVLLADRSTVYVHGLGYVIPISYLPDTTTPNPTVGARVPATGGGWTTGILSLFRRAEKGQGKRAAAATATASPKSENNCVQFY